MTSSPDVCVSCQSPLPPQAAYCPACGLKQDQEATGIWPSERRLVTILFADLASFTDATRDADPEDVTEMLNLVFSRLMVECDREDGYLDKTVGDQLMVLFGAPRAHEDDPARAVRAALGMQEAMNELSAVMRDKIGTSCSLHIGINTGLVVWGQVGPSGRTSPTVIGDAVNLASRLQGLSDGGQTLVSESVYLRTRQLFDYDELKPIEVRGKPERVPIYSPLRLRKNGATNRHFAETNVPLIERNRELDALRTHWVRAMNGDPQMLLITGDAGLGKSRLLTAFADMLHLDTLSKTPHVYYASSESASDEHYRPLAQLITMLCGLEPGQTDLSQRRRIEDRIEALGLSDKEYLPLLGYLLGWYDSEQFADQRLSPERLQQLAVESLAALILKQATRRPLLVIVDDLQWADAITVDFLNRLAEALQSPVTRRVEHQLMVVASSRPPGGSLLDSMLLSQIVTLGPLSDLGRQDLVHALLPGWGLPSSLFDRLMQESGGNPFYLIEVIHQLIQSGQIVRKDGAWHMTRPVSQIDVPPSVESLVMTTLDSLDQVCRIVLQHASVIGPRFKSDLLAAITPVEDLGVTLNRLEHTGLIARCGGNEDVKEYCFPQRITREVIYHTILRRTRRRLHDEIAKLTEAKNERDLDENTTLDDLEAVAYHYTSGSQRDKVVTYNYLLGAGNLNRFEFDDAYQHLQSAWEALNDDVDESDPTLRYRVAEALGDASTFTGDFLQARLCYESMREAMVDEREMASWYHKLGRLSLQEGEAEAAVEAYTQALDAAAPEDALLIAQIEAEMRLLFDWV
jgi:adenylate cyclase